MHGSVVSEKIFIKFMMTDKDGCQVMVKGNQTFDVGANLKSTTVNV
jgi:hypothetical protein